MTMTIERRHEIERKSRMKHREERKAKKWGHFSKGKTCAKCSAPVDNRSVRCLLCRGKKEVCLDLNSKRYREKYPLKIRARKRIANLIKRGKLQRLPCEICKNPKTEAHHPNHAEPLNIVWLCRKHHLERDKQEKGK